MNERPQRYDSGIADPIDNYIILSEKAIWNTTEMDLRFTNFAKAYKIKYNSKVIINSAYRDKTSEYEKNKQEPGAHSYGKAIDVQFPSTLSTDDLKKKFIDFILQQGFSGIGLYKWGVHLDYGYANKQGKRTWTSSEVANQEPLPKIWAEIYNEKLKPWRFGDNYKPGGINITGEDDVSENEDANIEIPKFIHPNSNKNAEVIEGANDSSLIADYNFNFDNGKMLFGDLFLYVPPININISSHNQTANFETVRTAGNPILSTDQEATNIDISLIFPNIDSINKQLRRIIAMYIRTPIIPIKNEFLLKSLKKHNNNEIETSIPVVLNSLTLSTIPGYPNSIQASLNMNEIEHRILVNSLKFLVDDNDVVEQNGVVAYYGDRSNKTFSDKVTVNTTTEPYKSLPFMKYYQALLHKDEDNSFILDPNGEPLKTKDDNFPIVYKTEDRSFYNKKYLAEYEIEQNKVYTLKYYEADINLVEERARNRERYKTRLQNLTQIMNILEGSDQLKYFEYDPKNPNTFINSLFTELKDYFNSFGNKAYNGLSIFTSNITGPQSLIYKEVILPYLVQAYPDLENITVGGPNSPAIIIKNDDILASTGKRLTLNELINLFSKKQYGVDAKDNPDLDKDISTTFETIFGHLKLELDNEIKDQMITYLPVKTVILGGDERTVITNITANFSNKLVPIYLQYWTKPAYQHFGSNNWNFTMNIRTTNINKVEEIRQMVEIYRQTAKKIMNMRPELVYKNASYIDFSANPNSFLDMLGIKNAIITDYNFNSVEGQPGVTDILLKFEQADLTIDTNEKVTLNSSSPDRLINYFKEFILKKCVYDSVKNVSYLMKKHIKSTGDMTSDSKNLYQFIKEQANPLKYIALENDDYDAYIILHYLELIATEYKYKSGNFEVETDLQYRKPFEDNIGTIHESFINDIIRDFQTTLLDMLKSEKNANKWVAWSEKWKDLAAPTVATALIAGTGPIGATVFGYSIYEAIMGKKMTLLAGIEKLFTPITGAFSLFSKTYSVIASYFNDSRLYARILELIYDPSFESILPQFNDEMLVKLYNNFKVQKEKLTTNYPDLYLPAFFNKYSEIISPIYTPPDFYFKNYTFINDIYIDEVKDLINNTFNIETALFAIQGKIDYQKYKSLEGMIEKNKKELNELLGKDGIDNLKKVFELANTFCDKYYDDLYKDGKSEIIKLDRTVPLVEAEQFFYICLKNMLIQSYKGKDISKLIPKGELGSNLDKTIKEMFNNLKFLNKEGEPSKGILDLDQVMGSLQQNITDTSYLNLVHKAQSEDSGIGDKVNSLNSYWGLGNKGAKLELNRLERIQNAKNFSNLLRIGKAFPTFKIYFIEEDKNEWLYFDDFYSYSAINSIEHISNKNAASDTIVIKLSNLANRLTNEKTETLNTEQYGEKRDNRNPENEQKIESLLLKAGTNMLVKLGYSNNPMELSTIFQGVITEIRPGSIVEIVGQSYGNQLNTQLEQYSINWTSLEKQFGDIVTFVLGKIPGMNKLGKYSPVSIGKSDPLRTPGNLWFRGLHSKFSIVSFFSGIDIDNFNSNDPRDDNIYLQYSADKSFFSNLTFDWKIYNQTVWEVIQEILLFHPDYIAKVLPYNEDMIPGHGDIRQTLYVGPKTGAYKYTDKFGVIADKLKNIKWEELITDVKSKWSSWKSVDQSRLVNITNKRARIDYFSEPGTADLVKKLTEFITSFWSLNSFIDSRFYDNLDINFIETGNFDFNQPNDCYEWLQKNGYQLTKFINNLNKEALRTRDSALEYIFNENWKLNPQYKPVRNDHIINSMNHIIQNNITASADNMYNKVVLTFPKNEPVYSSDDFKPSKFSKETKTYEVVVDDDINEESIRTYNTFQKNIDTNFFDLLDSNLKLVNQKKWIFGGSSKGSTWKDTIKRVAKSVDGEKKEEWQIYPTYMRVAMNILAKQMEGMYTGDLTIWGNPDIKTWDIIHLDDIVNDMSGSFEVEQVIHRFDTQNGFITILKPNLITHVQNADAMADQAIVSEIMKIASNKAKFSSFGNAIMPVDFPTNLFIGALPAIGSKMTGKVATTAIEGIGKLFKNTAATSAIATGAGSAILPAAIIGSALYGAWKGFSAYSDFIVESVGKLYGRNAIWFAPLKYKGKPYVAGLDGYKEDTYTQHVLHRMRETNPIQRLGYAHNAIDAYLIDGDKTDMWTYWKTIFYGKGS